MAGPSESCETPTHTLRKSEQTFLRSCSQFVGKNNDLAERRLGRPSVIEQSYGRCRSCPYRMIVTEETSLPLTWEPRNPRHLLRATCYYAILSTLQPLKVLVLPCHEIRRCPPWREAVVGG